MKINAIVEGIPGTTGKRYIVEIIDDGHVISRAQDHVSAKKGQEMASAAFDAVQNLRALANAAERTLIAMGILKGPMIP